MGSFAIRISRRRIAVAIVLVVAFATPTLSPAAAETTYTRAQLQGESGSDGRHHFYELPNVSVTGTASSLRVVAKGGLHTFTVDAVAPIGETLVAGQQYETVGSPPTATEAQLTIMFGCWGSPGRLVVEELETDGDAVTRLSIRFEVHCDVTGGTIYGAVVWNATEPYLAQRVTPSRTLTQVPQRQPIQRQTVTLDNTGTAPLDVGTVSISGPFTPTTPMAIVEDECSGTQLAPGASCSVSLEVDIATQGDKYGKLRFPTSFTDFAASGHFEALLRVKVYDDPSRFTEQAINVPGRLRPLVGDWDGDELDHDIFWYQPGPGQDSLWFADGDRTWTKQSISVGGIYEPVVGYFDGDAVTDVLWYRPGGGADWLWYGKPGGGFRARPVTVNGLFHPVVGDFDGNGVDDILWYGPGMARDALWLGRSSGSFRAVTIAVNGVYDWIVPMDPDGSDRTSLLFWRADRKAHPSWRAQPGGGIAGVFSAGTTMAPDYGYPLVGWFDPDERSDLFWYGPGSLIDSLWISGRAPVRYYVSRQNFVAFAANFSGDNQGRDELLWWETDVPGSDYWSADTNTEGRLRPRTYSNTTMPFSTTWAVFGYFDRIDANNAVDILWYGEGTAKDLMFWGNDIDGPPPATSTGASHGGMQDRDGFRRLVGAQPRR